MRSWKPQSSRIRQTKSWLIPISSRGLSSKNSNRCCLTEKTVLSNYKWLASRLCSVGNRKTTSSLATKKWIKKMIIVSFLEWLRSKAVWILLSQKETLTSCAQDETTKTTDLRHKRKLRTGLRHQRKLRTGQPHKRKRHTKPNPKNDYSEWTEKIGML